MKILDINLVDRISVPTERKLTDAGQMHVPCKFARTGTQLYTAGQLGLKDKEANEVIVVHREAVDVFDEASMASFRSAPVTIGHPKDAEGKSLSVTADNAKELQVGMLEGMPVQDEDTLGGVLVLSAQAAIDALEDGTQELSAGYVCDIELSDDGEYFQRNIRANHIAIVAKGRAGTSCRISDEALEVADEATLKSLDIEVEEKQDRLFLTTDAQALTDAQEALAAQVALVDELKSDLVAATSALDAMAIELGDAKTAAEEGVTARCKAIENARLISDIRDLGDKTVAQIERMVVEDQMQDKDLSEKSDAYISAMFEILVDSLDNETPMGKLVKKAGVIDTEVVAKPIDKVAAARQASIERSKNANK